MPSFVPPKRAVAFTFFVGLISRASRPQLQANPTLAAGDVQISKDGGAFANLTTLPVVTPAAGRAVQVDLSAAEMTADNIVVQFVDAAGAEWDDLFINIQTAARQINDLAFPNVSGRGIDVSTLGDVDADVRSWLGSAVRALVLGRPEMLEGVIRSGINQAATATTITLDASASAVDDFYNGLLVFIPAFVGATDPQTRLIVDYVGATKVATIAPAWAVTPPAVDPFVILPMGRMDIQLWKGIEPNALIAGRVDANAQVVGTAAIDAAAIATDAIGSAEFAQAAADKIWASATRALTDKVGFDLTVAAKEDVVAAVKGTADAGGSTTTIVDAERTEADVGYWKGSFVVMTSGPAIGQIRRISAFAPLTDTITVSPAFTAAIAVGNTYLILRSGGAEMLVDAIKAATIDAPSIATAAITAAKFAAGAIDAAAIATGAVDADALALDAVNEIADGLLKRDFTGQTGEPQRSMLNALRKLINKWSIAGTTLTVTKEDDIATAYTQAITATAGANPITAIDTV